eukprot:361329-Chlamydomonas_euryale.AAC.7
MLLPSHATTSAASYAEASNLLLIHPFTGNSLVSKHEQQQPGGRGAAAAGYALLKRMRLLCVSKMQGDALKRSAARCARSACSPSPKPPPPQLAYTPRLSLLCPCSNVGTSGMCSKCFRENESQAMQLEEVAQKAAAAVSRVPVLAPAHPVSPPAEAEPMDVVEMSTPGTAAASVASPLAAVASATSATPDPAATAPSAPPPCNPNRCAGT